MGSFMTMRAMVEEMYQEFKKGRGESTSTSKQDKGIEEPLLDGHSEGKGKGKGKGQEVKKDKRSGDLNEKDHGRSAVHTLTDRRFLDRACCLLSSSLLGKRLNEGLCPYIGRERQPGGARRLVERGGELPFAGNALRAQPRVGHYPHPFAEELVAQRGWGVAAAVGQLQAQGAQRRTTGRDKAASGDASHSGSLLKSRDDTVKCSHGNTEARNHGCNPSKTKP